MLRKDIKTGMVYAYNTSRHGEPEPVVFLSADLYTTRGPYGDQPQWVTKAAPGAKADSGHYHSTGYLIVRRHWHSDVPFDDLTDRMLAVNLAEVESAFDGERIGDADLMAVCLTRLNYVNGLYRETVEQARARDAEEREKRQRSEQLAARRRQRATAVVASLHSHGVSAVYDPSGWVQMRIGEAEKLGALIGSSNRARSEGEASE